MERLPRMFVFVGVLMRCTNGIHEQDMQQPVGYSFNYEEGNPSLAGLYENEHMPGQYGQYDDGGYGGYGGQQFQGNEPEQFQNYPGGQQHSSYNQYGGMGANGGLTGGMGVGGGLTGGMGVGGGVDGGMVASGGAYDSLIPGGSNLGAGLSKSIQYKPHINEARLSRYLQPRQRQPRMDFSQFLKPNIEEEMKRQQRAEEYKKAFADFQNERVQSFLNAPKLFTPQPFGAFQQQQGGDDAGTYQQRQGANDFGAYQQQQGIADVGAYQQRQGGADVGAFQQRQGGADVGAYQQRQGVAAIKN